MILAESLRNSACSGVRLDKKLNRTRVLRAAYLYTILSIDPEKEISRNAPFCVWMRKLAEKGKLYSQENPAYVRTSSLFAKQEMNTFYRLAIYLTYLLGTEVELFAAARIVLTPSQIIYEVSRWGLLRKLAGERELLADPVSYSRMFRTPDYQSLQTYAAALLKEVLAFHEDKKPKPPDG